LIDWLPVSEETATAPRSAGAASEGPARRLRDAPGLPLVLFAAFAVGCLLLYAGALRGQFVSDDVGYFHGNPYTDELSLENVATILDPFGAASLHTGNYAPVHVLLHALEWQIFAENTLGYHVVNVLVHALNATLLVLLLLQVGLGLAPAAAAGALFAVHPANVEAVAWISQLKTTGSTAFALGALLAFRRHPLLSAPLFALGLLTKASAAFALPMAAALVWCRAGRPNARVSSARHVGALGVWGALFLLYAVPQMQSFQHMGAVDPYSDAGVHARTVAAVGARYLVMAASSFGVSAFQEPDPARSWLDPWWLVALPLGAALAARAVLCLRRRRVEGAFWVAAAAAFLPISQIFPFPTPTADRYLYAILPGLLGGALLLGRDLYGWAARRGLASGRALALGALALAVGVGVVFAARSAERARLWRHEALLLQDAARHYPDGSTAHLLEAQRAAQVGDARAAAAALRRAADRGFDHFMGVLQSPSFAPVVHAPPFQAVLREMAGRFLEQARERGYSTQPELYRMAQAHLVRDDFEAAEAALERSLAAGGPLTPTVRQKLQQVRRRTGRR